MPIFDKEKDDLIDKISGIKNRTFPAVNLSPKVGVGNEFAGSSVTKTPTAPDPQRSLSLLQKIMSGNIANSQPVNSAANAIIGPQGSFGNDMMRTSVAAQKQRGMADKTKTSPIGRILSDLMDTSVLGQQQKQQNYLKILNEAKQQGRQATPEDIGSGVGQFANKRAERTVAEILEVPMTVGAGTFAAANPLVNIPKILATMGIHELNPIGKIQTENPLGRDVRDILNMATSGALVEGAFRMPQNMKKASTMEAISVIKKYVKDFETKVFKEKVPAEWVRLSEESKTMAIIQEAERNPAVGDYIASVIKKDRLSRKRGLLKNEKAETNLPEGELPKKIPIAPNLLGKSKPELTPTQIESNKLINTEEKINAEIQKLGDEIRKKEIEHNKKYGTPSEGIGGKTMNFATKEEEQRLYDLKQKLPTFSEKRKISKENINKRIEERNNRLNKVTIPEFKNTDEAIAYGKDAIGNDRKKNNLRNAKSKQDEITKQIRSIKDPTDAQLQQGINEAVKSQFLREAIETAEGKISAKEIDTYNKEVNPKITTETLKTTREFFAKKGDTEAVSKIDALLEKRMKPENSPKKIYHGTDKKFDDFDLQKMADGSVWFTDNKSKVEQGEVGATGRGEIIERLVDEGELKLGGYDEQDKFSTDELIRDGYDGLKLVDEGETTYRIFYPKKLKKVIKEDAPINQTTGINPPADPPKTTFEQPQPPEKPKFPTGGKVKKIINKNTGITKQRKATKLAEEQLLRRELQQEQKASMIGFKEGKKLGVEETKQKELSRRTGIINSLKNVMNNRIDNISRKKDLRLLKEDIKARDKLTSLLAKLNAKNIEQVKNIKRKAELTRLQDDIKRRDVLRIKKELTQYVKNNIPKESQSKYISSIVNVKTGGQLSSAFRRVDKDVKSIERKSLVSDIKNSVDKVLKSKNIDVKIQEQINDIFNEIDFVKRQPSTLKKLSELKNVFERKAELGEDVEIPRRIWKKLDLLLRKPADQLNIAELKNIKDEIDLLANVGKTKLRVRDDIYNLQKDQKKKQIIEGAMAIEKNPLIERQPGEKLGIKKSFRNALKTIHNQAIRLDLVNTPMDSFFDLIDGGNQSFDGPVYRIFKQQVDTDFQSFLRDSAKDKKLLMDMFSELKISQSDSEIMGVYAAKIQKGGVDKLLETGVKQEVIDKAALNERTEKIYKLWRKISDELKPEIAKIMREEWNIPFDEVENYFPFTTDFEKMSDVEIFNRFGKDFNDKSILENNEQKRAGKKVKFGFMESRVGGKQKIQLDFMDVAMKHIDNAHYMINMSRTLRMLKELSNDKSVESKLGELGTKYTKEWLDLMVKKGGRLGDQQIAILDMLRRNFGIARLGYNISTGIIQTTAIMDGAMILGNDAFLGINDIIVNSQSRNFVLENMPEVKERAGDDPAYQDFSKIPILSTAQRLGYNHIKFFDRLAAMGVAMGAYRKKLKMLKIDFDYDKPNKEAITYAQSIVRRTQASSLFKDTPASLRGGLTGNRSVDKFINQFQTFMLNRWNNIRNYTFRANIQGGRNKDTSSRDFKAAFNATFYLALAVLVEVSLRRGEKEFEKKTVEFLTQGYIPEKKRMTAMQEYFVNLSQTIPYVSQGISMAVYRGDLAPAMSGLRDIATGAPGIFTRKKPESKKKAALDLFSGVGSAMGIPGVGQFEKTSKMFIDAKTKNSVVGMYKEAILEKDLDKKKNWNDRADKLARELGLSIKRMKESAERSLAGEQRGFVSKLEKKYHDKTDQEFSDIMNKKIRTGELSTSGAKRVENLRKRRKKDADKLEKEIMEQDSTGNRVPQSVWDQIDALTQ